MPSRDERPYHHGDLPRAMIDAAVRSVERSGGAALSIRSLAREVGVTHGAAAHHFGDKNGLLRAVATQGFHLLADRLDGARRDGGFADVGLAYVRFAVDHPGYFEVMFRSEVVRTDDPALAAARARAAEALYGAAAEVADATGGDQHRAGLAGWAYVHGLATLWRDGALPPGAGDDPVALAEQLVPYLFQAAAAQRRKGGRGR